jgi:hypothetical protein
MADSLNEKSEVMTMPSRSSGDSDLEKGQLTEDPGQYLGRVLVQY